jgi:SAM-dependent methyltransferase
MSTSLLSRFLDANRRICDARLAPRLYAAPHTFGIEYWMHCWLGTGAFGTTPGGDFLEFGSGADTYLCRKFGDRFASLSATDIERPAVVPPHVSFAQCGEDTLPFPDASFDTVGARSVFEHVPRPERTFAELSRILKPGGSIIFNLPNKWDYVSVIARLSGRFKHDLLKLSDNPEWDDFPVCYRCNTRRDLQRTIEGTGLTLTLFRPLPSEPHYLRFFVPLFVGGAIYQFGISLLQLDALQPSFMVVLTKPTQPRPPTA